MKAPKIFQLISVILIMMFSIASFAQKPAKPDPGLKKYGNVAFADPVHHKYPIDTHKHILGSWRSIHEKKNAAKYTPEELKEVHTRILDAGTAHGMHLKSKEEGK